MRGAAPGLRVAGFRAGGIRCGIKPNAPDLALIASDRPARVAGVFTRSTVVGPAVELSRERSRRGWARAVIVNSGNANVAVGPRGRRDAETMARLTARALGCRPEEVLVASTGVIGEPLPMERLRHGIPRLAARLREDGLSEAARAILTTDTRPKWAERTLRARGRVVRVAGIAKGSGMIEPRMATLLAFVLTDAAVGVRLLRGMLRRACAASFNRITVDGETSTSDTALLLASGAAGGPPLVDPAAPEARRLAEAVEEVCVELARAVAADGEGATRLVRVRVSGAASPAEAERAVRRIANSPLVKTAIFGADPNWGRVLQAVGAGRVRVALGRCEVRIGGVAVFRRGVPLGRPARARAAAALRRPEVELAVHLGAGRARAELWTCDLSYGYVRINAEYHS